MKYNYREGIAKQKSRKWIVLPVLALGTFAYAAITYFAPTIFYVIEPADRTAKYLTTTPPDKSQDKLYLPKINTMVRIVSADNGEEAALNQGAVQRSSTAGNPKDGGTYVLAARRFNLELTPDQTAKKSSLFHLDKLSKEDDIYVDYQGIRYAYKIVARTKVNVGSTNFDQRNNTTQLVLYTAEVDDNRQREVVTAKLTGTVVWTNGQPRLQAF